MRPDLPTGTVTFLFTDVEGSTKLLHELGPEGYADALAEHRRIVRDAFVAHGGVEVDTQGDAFFVAFPTADGAVDAAAAARDALAAGPIRVRMGIHTGTPHVGDEGYVGADVHRAARIASAGHGGQVLVSAATAAAVGTDGLHELGEHRFKDFAEPVPIFQLGDERFPPLKTISNTNLPRPASSFVGRDSEVAEVAALLQDGGRLLTLTGPGGSGKTRLAIEAAASVAPEFKAGVFWVGLAPLRDPALVTETIGHTLGAKDALAQHVGEREMLLLLDNFEQVIAAAPDLAGLVETCPNLRLLVTSRERLRVRGEIEYPVLPLADPEAVDLFCARAQLEADDIIGQLCRRLDNLPLAIELAAARASVLTPAQILDRISQRLDLLRGDRDADPRQQTLRATIEWSHELLTPDEQRLFARLAVFAGGATLDAAEAVAGADLDTLQSLVDKSLVRRTGERFWMLETIREFAVERLAASGEADDVRRRHAEFFLTLAEEAEPHVERDAGAWVPRLEAEASNLRTALDCLVAFQETERALAFAGALATFWESHISEGRQRLENLLSADDRANPARAKALIAAALAARHGGDADAARLRAEEAAALNHKLGNVRGTAIATVLLGLSLADLGHFSRARDLFDEGAQLFASARDDDNVLWARRLLGWMYEELGDLDQARLLHEQNLERARALGNRQMEGQTLTALAYFASAQGRPMVAISMMQDALRIDRDRAEILQTSLDLVRFARALTRAGVAYVDAARFLGCAAAIRDEIGAGVPPWLATTIDEAVVIIRTHLDEPTFAAAWKEGGALTADTAIDLALAIAHAP